MRLRSIPARGWRASTVIYGRASGRNYVEDYVRVYPDGYQYYPLGVRCRQAEPTRQNFINHRRFYEFCAQFASGRDVYDIGCGSGHGLEVLGAAGARTLAGCDLSRHAVRYARRSYGFLAQITRQDAVQLQYPDDVADVAVCSEVLEHVRDYGREGDLLRGLNRITRPGGLVVLSTPNLEVSPGHGFTFEELSELVFEHYDEALLFENKLCLDNGSREAYEARRRRGRVGLLSSCAVEAGESFEGTPKTELATVDLVAIGEHSVDTARLHNTHSFVIVALNR
jgi:2-polyprenyl-3-methyl-5-hydroxy-6-metoxy-1,4-benzoquinol methylase